MKRALLLLSCAVLLSGFWPLSSQAKKKPAKIYHKGWIDFNKNGQKDPYEDPSQPIFIRVDDLLKRMTLEEKTCQMATLYGYGRVLKDELPTPEWKQRVWKDGIANIDEHLNGLDRPSTRTKYSWPPSRHAWAINQVQRFFVEETRLGIPVDFTNEGIRGLCHEKATSFPAQIGVASTWDVDLVSQIGHITGSEARALGYTNIYSPILDLARDPRWGRTVETYGEDPYLAAALGVAQVRALQAEHVVSTPKHFAVYSVPKGGRDGYARTDPHEPLHEVEVLLLKPFRDAFIKGGALGTMSSYNDYDGVPITGSYDFLTRRLRQDWGFRGYVVSDSRAVDFIYSKHHVAYNYKDAVRQAVEAGLNVRTNFTFPEVFIEPLRELVREGTLSMKVIDDRVRDVLRVKFWLGLFDHPYMERPEQADSIVANPEHQRVALQVCRESLVLLKNENHLLPLGKDVRKILVTGPNAAAIRYALSRYGPSKVKVISVLEGIRQRAGSGVEVTYTKGCDLIDPNWPESEILPQPLSAEEQAEIDKAVQMAKEADVAIAVVGEDERVVGESRSRTSLNLPGRQLDLVKALVASGTPTVVVLINGRPLSINWIARNVQAILEAWFPGAQGGQAIAEALFGDFSPSGKLPITFPKTVGQIPMNFPFKPGSQAGTYNHTRIEGVLFPFGHGLSYTSFRYSNLRITPRKTPNGDVRVECDVRNVGQRAGAEVVQLYIRDETSSVTTYVKNLRGFRRVFLQPGETRHVVFDLSREDLQLLNRDFRWVLEPGVFKVMVGSSSEDIRLEGEFEVI